MRQTPTGLTGRRRQRAEKRIDQRAQPRGNHAGQDSGQLLIAQTAAAERQVSTFGMTATAIKRMDLVAQGATDSMLVMFDS